MFSFTGLMLVLVATHSVYGQNVQVTLDKDCYNVGDDMTLTATYAGSDVYSAVIWYFSGRVSMNVIVLTLGCSVFQTDTGFPLARMTYKCPPETTDTNTYQLILGNLVESDLDSYDWGATFQVSSASNPDVVRKQPVLCKATPEATPEDGLEWWKILLIVLGIILGLFLAGIILGCFLKANSDLFYNCKSDCCDECISKICPCCKGLPTWFKILGFTGIGTPVALGMLLVWKCCKGLPGRESDNGATQMRRMNQKVSRSFRTWTSWQNAEEKPSTVKDNKKLLDNMDFNDITDNGDTWNDNVDTRSSPKKDKIRSLDNKTQSKSPGKAEGVNKEKPAVVKQNQHADQADKKHLESEEKKPSRSRILPPVGTNHSSQLPNIPGHDKKGRGLSANFGDDDHPLVAIDIPAQKAGALPTITDTPREDKKKAKKKKKDKQEDNQNTETVLNF